MGKHSGGRRFDRWEVLWLYRKITWTMKGFKLRECSCLQTASSWTLGIWFCWSSVLKSKNGSCYLQPPAFKSHPPTLPASQLPYHRVQRVTLKLTISTCYKLSLDEISSKSFPFSNLLVFPLSHSCVHTFALTLWYFSPVKLSPKLTKCSKPQHRFTPWESVIHELCLLKSGFSGLMLYL